MEIMQNKQITPPSLQQENDIDDDNRDDKEDEEDEKAYLKSKENGFTMKTLTEKTRNIDYFLDSASRSSLGDDNIDLEVDNDDSTRKLSLRTSKMLTNNNLTRRQSKNFNYSPDTTDYDSNYGDFDFDNESPLRFLPSEINNPSSFNTTEPATVPSATVDLSGGPITNYSKYCSSMPVLEDGLSSGHASDNENNNPVSSSIDISAFNKRNNSTTISTIQKQYQAQNLANNLTSNSSTFYLNNNISILSKKNTYNNNYENENKTHSVVSPVNYHSFYPMRAEAKEGVNSTTSVLKEKIHKNRDSELESLYTMSKY